MVEAAGVRVRWADLPVEVRAAVEDVLGSRVVEARTQRGGFSPGSAARVVTADGRRGFVKAVSSALNPASPVLHRREIAVGRAMPADPAVPALLGSWEGRADDADWVALVLADVEGRIFDRYPDEAIVYPGHGVSTTLGAERPHLGEWRERGW